MFGCGAEGHLIRSCLGAGSGDLPETALVATKEVVVRQVVPQVALPSAILVTAEATGAPRTGNRQPLTSL